MDNRDFGIVILLAFLVIIISFFFSNEAISVYLISGFTEAIRTVIVMVWITWWALVLGFGIAGGVEAWISSNAIASKFENYNARSLGVSSFLGFASSSCSYSAIATAKNIFKKGGSPSLAFGSFMFASTNLVIEIGLVMWVLLGWKFVLANYIGGFFLILFSSFIIEYGFPKTVVDTARKNIMDSMVSDPVCGMDVNPDESEYKIEYKEKEYYFCSSSCKETFEPDEIPENRPIIKNITSSSGWISLAKKQWSEWQMLWKEIAFGFILAGIITGFVPRKIWLSIFDLFSSNPTLFLFWSTIAGAIIGIATFVCSVGNVPFAAVLWNNGLLFGGVFSYIYADLIVPPIVKAYKKYYGTVFALLLSGIIFAGAIFSGVITHIIFDSLNAIPPSSSAEITKNNIELDYKAILNLIATIIFVFLWIIKERE